MKSHNITFILLVILAWSMSVINTSGYGVAHDTPTKTYIILSLLFLYALYKGVQRISFGGSNTYLTTFTLISFVFIPLIVEGSWEGFQYLLTAITTVFCFSQAYVTPKFLKLSGYIVAGLGAGIAMVYSRTDTLSGWNDNSIAMIMLFSFIYYAITLVGNMNGNKLTIGLAISAFFSHYIVTYTNSRSAFIFIVLMLAIAYFGSFTRKWIQKKKFIFWALNIPLLIAIFVVFNPNSSLLQVFEDFNTNYQKTMFNGRDELWKNVFLKMPDNFFLGELEFKINHHNSAMAVLGVFGVIGYVCWYYLLRIPLKKAIRFIKDDTVLGCVVAFLVIFWQQSFDLGFVNACPNLLPYMILGLAVGRSNTICYQKHLITKKLRQTNNDKQKPAIPPQERTNTVKLKHG